MKEKKVRKELIHDKIKSIILEYQLDALRAGKSLVYLGRSAAEGCDTKMVDFGLTAPYDNPESLRELKVTSMFSISPSDLKKRRLGEFLMWLRRNGVGVAVYED